MSAIISTIIVNYNAGALLQRCVDSLVECRHHIEIVIVDNASTDQSLDFLTELPQYASIQVVKNCANRGFAAACNAGARLTSAPFLLFLNPDCTVAPDALAELLDVMATDQHIGLVTGLLTNADGTEQAGGRRAIPTPWRSFVREFGLVRFAHRWPRLFSDFNLHQQPLPDHPIEVEATSGACMLIRREAMADVGHWDEGYFLHCEDLDLCMRFRQKGWKILFVPSAIFLHDQGSCSRSRPLFVEWHKHKGMIRFYRKFFRRQYPGVLWPLVACGVWLRFTWVFISYSTRVVTEKIGAKNVQ